MWISLDPEKIDFHVARVISALTMIPVAIKDGSMELVRSTQRRNSKRARMTGFFVDGLIVGVASMVISLYCRRKCPGTLSLALENGSGDRPGSTGSGGLPVA